MPEISGAMEVSEISRPEAQAYKEIKPEKLTSVQEAKSFWDHFFDGEIANVATKLEQVEQLENSLEKTVSRYFSDLKARSECPDTIVDQPFQVSDLKKRTPEDNSRMRDEFDDKRTQLKREWAEANGRSWPTYDRDIYSANGKLIRKAGSDYDAHHIQPLGMGGRNEVSNITPLNAEVHYDKQGIHASDSPYSRLDQMLGGMD